MSLSHGIQPDAEKVNFFKFAEPLNKLLRKNIELQWDENCHVAFKKLKTSLISPELLIYLDFWKPFTLTIYAIMKALGAILSQGDWGKDRPIAYTFYNCWISFKVIPKQLHNTNLVN